MKAKDDIARAANQKKMNLAVAPAVTITSGTAQMPVVAGGPTCKKAAPKETDSKKKSSKKDEEDKEEKKK